MSEFDPRHQKILDILKDGKPHKVKAIIDELFGDNFLEQSPRRTVAVYVCQIRKVLEKRGESIVCEFRNRQMHYRWVILKGDS